MKHDKLTQAIIEKNKPVIAWPFPTEHYGVKPTVAEPATKFITTSKDYHFVSDDTTIVKEPLVNLTEAQKEQLAEKDPHGKDLNSPGAKADAGKDRVWLFLAGFSNALEEVARVTTVGANKYTPDGWVDVPDGSNRYMDAFGRHLLALGQGNIVDDGPKGTGCLHKAQMIWNLLASLELELRDD